MAMTPFWATIRESIPHILLHVFLCGSANQEINTFIQQGHIKLIKSGSKYIKVSTKILSGTSVFNIDNNEHF